jgi:3-hydroxyacyl-CoA dehydrogenase
MAVRSMALSARGVHVVTVIGCGLMGSGIAQVTAQAGIKVTMVDQKQEIVDKAYAGIRKSIERVAKKKVPDDHKGQSVYVEAALANLSVTTNMEDACRDADLIIEAVPEMIELKHKLFTQVEAAAKPSAILATNTSSLRLIDISKPLKRLDNFGGLHFFNPVPIMKLLEVIRMPETSDATFHTLLEYGKQIGKTTVKCKDTPGFVVNRLLVPYMMEALRMAERGDATTHDIDTAMKLGAGYPMGPFELLDYVGLDTNKFILDGWSKQFPGNPLFAPSDLLNKMVAEGKLGRKSGEGFYKY